MVFVIYETNGRIIMNTSTNVDPETIIEPGQSYLVSDYLIPDDLYYISDGDVVERPSMEIRVSKQEIEADGFDFTTISGIPVGAKCWIIGGKEPFQVTDEILEFSTDTPGTYTIEFSLFPYRDHKVVIHAV